jgi:hypothetical protein
MKRIGDDPLLAEALGIVTYWGNDTSGPSGRGKPRPSIRIPEFFDEAAERERLRLQGSSHAALPPLSQSFNSGFNNFSRSA